jgi:hypothetical protein
MMQVAAEVSFQGHKLVFDYISDEEARLIATKLGSEKALIFIDNFTDSMYGFQSLLTKSNIQLVGFDRDYNFDIVSHRVGKSVCQIIDVTELSSHDIQEIYFRIPQDIKSDTYYLPETSKGVTPSLFEVVESNITKSSLQDRFRDVLQQLNQADPNMLDFLLACCYVHKCRTPISMDMLIAYFRGRLKDYRDIYTIREHLRTMLADYVGELDDGEQDYYAPRSVIIAEAIIDQAPSSALKRVLLRFNREISHYRVHRFDIFRRKAYDADLIRKAFTNWQEGLDFYKMISTDDPSPYLRQQCALYLAQKRKFTEAFVWIDEAIMKSAGRIPSIRNSHAIILFKANIDRQETDGTVQRTLKQSMDILSECYHYDKRKIYHALTFTDQALKYYEIYGDEIAYEYIETAQKWLEEEYKKSPWHRNIKYLLDRVSRILRDRVKELGKKDD